MIFGSGLISARRECTEALRLSTFLGILISLRRSMPAVEDFRGSLSIPDAAMVMIPAEMLYEARKQLGVTRLHGGGSICRRVSSGQHSSRCTCPGAARLVSAIEGSVGRYGVIRSWARRRIRLGTAMRIKVAEVITRLYIFHGSLFGFLRFRSFSFPGSEFRLRDSASRAA